MKINLNGNFSFGTFVSKKPESKEFCRFRSINPIPEIKWKINIQLSEAET